MITSSDSIKSKLKNKSKETNIPADILLKMVMFERLVLRISMSEYKENFILKGGFLISSIFGVNLRSTMDIDATIKGIKVSKEKLNKTINEIINIKLEDNCTFEILCINDIRTEDIYNGYEVMLKATIDKIWSYITVDITTGDVITYKEVEYDYETILEQQKISLMTYNSETILAEKYEAIVSRGILNTRMKDYYDLYMFVNLKFSEIDIKTLIDAINNTARKRNTMNYIEDSVKIIEQIEASDSIRVLWEQYQSKFEYAIDINIEDVISTIKIIAVIIVPVVV